MKFGICGSTGLAVAAAAGGWEYIEENAQGMFRGLELDWQRPAKAALPVPSVNSMLPGSLKITGPDARHEPLLDYMGRLLARAAVSGVDIVVFGSGGARMVPDGWDRQTAVSQIASFLSAVAPIAMQNGVTIVIEPLNRGECNIINTVAEAMTYVHKVDHPNIRCLVDSYHLWLEDEPLSNVEAAMPWIAHAHVADRDGRVAPGESGASDYKPLFGVLKRAGYDRLISVECKGLDLATNGPRVLSFLKENWSAA